MPGKPQAGGSLTDPVGLPPRSIPSSALSFVSWLLAHSVETEFLFLARPQVGTAGETLAVGAAQVPLRFARHQRARRYILRVDADGAARVTVPRGGTLVEARRFAERHLAWIERHLRRRLTFATRPRVWLAGTRILFRGEWESITVASEAGGWVARCGDQTIPIASAFGDLRPGWERHFWRLAKVELPARVLTLAAEQGLTMRGISVRNQRSRWGSCSRRGTISLNWRLIQTPTFVRDYIVWHELMHLREMNHSRRFWAAVSGVCPRYREAERWLKEHRDLLR